MYLNDLYHGVVKSRIRLGACVCVCDDRAHASGLRECGLSILNQFCHLSYRLGAKTDTFTKKPRKQCMHPVLYFGESMLFLIK